MSSLGFYLPIKKWSSFDVYDKETIDEQLHRNVIKRLINRMFISPSNFLIRIPKFFSWNQPAEVDENGNLVTLKGEHNNNAFAEKLLRQMIEQEMIPQGETHDAITTVLSQIEAEKQIEASTMSDPNDLLNNSTSHLFEIDSFWWKFDLLYLK